MKGRVSKFSSEQIAQIVAAVDEHGAANAPKHLPFKIVSQLCQYYWRKANPEAPVKRRRRKLAVQENT